MVSDIEDSHRTPIFLVIVLQNCLHELHYPKLT